MSKQEKEEKAKEFWEYYESTQGTITITDPIVLDWCVYFSTLVSSDTKFPFYRKQGLKLIENK